MLDSSAAEVRIKSKQHQQKQYSLSTGSSICNAEHALLPTCVRGTSVPLLMPA